MCQSCRVPDVRVRPLLEDDRVAVGELFAATWGRPFVVGRGVGFDLTTLPTLVAEDDTGKIVGVLTYQVEGDAMEVVSIEAATSGSGIGSALLRAANDEAARRGLRRLWLITTNDNLDAIRLYQRRGLRITRVLPGAVDQARRLKPSIPMVGSYELPMRDELTLELRLDGATDVRAAGRAAVLRHVFSGVFDLWSLLAEPIDAADAVRALAMPHLGRVDAVTGHGAAGTALAALVARELGVPLVRPDSPAEALAGRRVLSVDPGVPVPPIGRLPDEAPVLAGIALLVDGLPPDQIDDTAVPVTALLSIEELAERAG